MTFPSLINLSAIGSSGFTLEGEGNNVWTGWSVSSAGDINGDGIDDFIVGAPFEPKIDPGQSGDRRGEAYVVFGKTGPFGTVDLDLLTPPDGFVIRSNIDIEQVGVSVASAGDINGDGIDDLVVGANATNNFAGAAYVIFGKTDPFVDIDVNAIPSGEGFAISGIDAGGNTGHSVASAGDMNGDGYDEVLISVRSGDGSETNAGAVYVLYGKAGGFSDIDLASFSTSDGFVILGDTTGDGTGYSVASAGDVDGDGYDDIIVGVPFGDDGGTNAGEAYVIFGSGAGYSDVDLSGPLDSDVAFKIVGAEAGGYAGWSVASAGDINGDGHDDLIVGARGSVAAPGAAYVIFGKGRDDLGEIDLGALAAEDGFLLRGIDGGDQVGQAVASAGDVDGDGFDDLLVGAPRADNYSNGADPYFNPFLAGSSWIIFGKPGGFGTIDLADGALPGGVVLLGGEEGGQAGFSVASAGDIDADGFDDVIVGAPQADVDGINGTGKAHVVFGQAGTPTVFPFVFELATDVSPVAGLVIDDGFDGGLGASVSDAGDFNGDGVDDVIVGAPTAGAGGAAFIIFGKDGGLPPIDLTALDPDDGMVIVGSYGGNYYLGHSVSSAGDVNGDGIDDVIVGDPDAYYGAGGAYVIYGRTDTDGGVINPGNPAEGFAIIGATPGEYAGNSVSGAGDVNGDGLADLIVGAYQSDGSGGGDTVGAVYVVYGSDTRTGPVDLASLDPSDGFAVEGLEDNSRLGFSVSSAGDFDGDGVDDMIFSAPLAYDSGPGPTIGKSYIIFGKTEAEGGIGPIDLAALDPGDGFALDDPGFFSLFGASVSAAGDVNGDGFDDVVIGGPFTFDYAGGPESGIYGAAYVLFGREDGFDQIDMTALAPDDGFAIHGPQDPDRPDAYAFAGLSVSGAGDVNGDGFDDLIVGAPYGFKHAGPTLAEYPGKAYVLFGKADGFSDIGLDELTPDQGFVIEGEEAGAYTGISVSGAGDVNGDGFDDLIVGEPGPDCGCGGDGKVYIIYGRGSVVADDAVGTLENGVATGSLFDDNGSGVDKASNGALAIAAVNGAAADVGVALALASGALLTVNSDGSYVYDPNDAFDYLAAPGSGAANSPATDTFTYTLLSGSSATVTVTITGVDNEDVLIGTGGTDVMSGGRDDDQLHGLGGNDQLFGGHASDRLFGGEGDDRLDGGTGHDHLEGGAGSDMLFGGIHSDRLDGGTGADTMAGGQGNDHYVVDHPGDVIVEQKNEGLDRVESSVSYDLPAHFEQLFLTGSGHLTGRGNSGDNRLVGNSGKNFLNGGTGNDIVDGGEGSDRLYGSEGMDLLIGRGGHDRFHFNTTLGPDNVDHIVDFTVGEDRIFLARYIFAKAGSGGQPDAAAFRLGDTALDGNDRILYDQASGEIFYDADGSGATAAILFATVNPGTPLTHADFFLYG